MWFWVVVFAASLAYTWWSMSNSSSTSSSMDPSSSEDVSAPTAEEGSPIPVLFGTRDIKDSNVVWWGRLSYTTVTG